MSAARALRPGAALVVLAVTAALAADQRFVRGEVAVLEAVNGWPRWIGSPLEVVMELGTLKAGLLLTAVVAVVTLQARATAAVLVAAFGAWHLDDVLKDLIERPRPSPGRADIVVRDAAHGWGYPSGHAAVAFALAVVLHGLVPPRWRWVPWVLATGAALARLYVGVHWPLDSLGGAALGVAVGGAAGLLLPSRYRRRRA